MLKKIALFVLIIIWFASASSANAIIYDVNRTVGAFGTIYGTIETDGTIGTLNQSNIIDWNFTLNGDSDLSTVGRLLGPLSGSNSSLRTFSFGFAPSTAFTTTITGSSSTLFVNFGTTIGEIFQIYTTNYDVVWQMQPGIPFQDELLRESYSGGNAIQTYAFHGPITQELGTAHLVPAPVPEPSTLILLSVGLGGIGFFRLKMKGIMGPGIDKLEKHERSDLHN